MRHLGRSTPFVLLALLVLAGCQENQEPIRTYTVQKHSAIQVPIETEATRPMEDASHRLLGAMVLDDNIAWFFKTITPVGNVTNELVTQFHELLEGLRLENSDKPTWSLGDRWEELPGSGMSTANLKLGEVEFSVTKLPVRSDTEPRQYILNNINRWRGQLQRLPISEAQLDGAVKKLNTVDNRVVTVVDIGGKRTPSTMPGGRPNFDAPSAQAPRLTYDAPGNWTEKPAGSMQVAKFVTGETDATAEISISQLGGAAGGVLANVNRWRGQVGLKPLTDRNEVDAEPLKVAGNDGALLEFRGPKGKSIRVAMVHVSGSVWFFKMMGDTAVVDDEAQHFREFLTSIQLN